MGGPAIAPVLPAFSLRCGPVAAWGPVLAGLAAAVLVATVVQQVSGFGFALFAVPMMALVVGPKDAVAIAMVAGLASSGVMAFGLRHLVARTELRRLLLGAAVGLPVGVVLLRQVPDEPLAVALGVVLLVMVALTARGARFGSTRPRVQIGAGVASGVLNGSLGTGGPPVVLLLQAADTEQHRFRATTTAFFAVCDAVAIPLIALSGAADPSAWAYAVGTFPAIAVGTLVGSRWARRVPAERFRHLVLALLVVTAVVTIGVALR